jgi:hypothetical protein
MDMGDWKAAVALAHLSHLAETPHASSVADFRAMVVHFCSAALADALASPAAQVRSPRPCGCMRAGKRQGQGRLPPLMHFPGGLLQTPARLLEALVACRVANRPATAWWMLDAVSSKGELLVGKLLAGSGHQAPATKLPPLYLPATEADGSVRFQIHALLQLARKMLSHLGLLSSSSSRQLDDTVTTQPDFSLMDGLDSSIAFSEWQWIRETLLFRCGSWGHWEGLTSVLLAD